MINRCEKCHGYYLVKMQTATNPVTGKMGMIVCGDKNCGHIHSWPDKN
jgi:hypothetical protein